jgi:hypothetical protein
MERFLLSIMYLTITYLMCFGESINMDIFLLQCQPGIAQGQESSAAFQAKTDQQWSVH